MPTEIQPVIIRGRELLIQEFPRMDINKVVVFTNKTKTILDDDSQLAGIHYFRTPAQFKNFEKDGKAWKNETKDNVFYKQIEVIFNRNPEAKVILAIAEEDTDASYIAKLGTFFDNNIYGNNFPFIIADKTTDALNMAFSQAIKRETTEDVLQSRFFLFATQTKTLNILTPVNHYGVYFPDEAVGYLLIANTVAGLQRAGQGNATVTYEQLPEFAFEKFAESTPLTEVEKQTLRTNGLNYYASKSSRLCVVNGVVSNTVAGSRVVNQSFYSATNRLFAVARIADEFTDLVLTAKANKSPLIKNQSTIDRASALISEVFLQLAEQGIVSLADKITLINKFKNTDNFNENEFNNYYREIQDGLGAIIRLPILSELQQLPPESSRSFPMTLYFLIADEIVTFVFNLTLTQ